MEKTIMKEDILEQLADEYLQMMGYFTIGNIKYKPSPSHPDYESSKDSVHSDIDIIGINPNHRGINRTWVVTCKSWQKGFNPEKAIKRQQERKKFGGREAWKSFHELYEPKWSESFINKIKELTGSNTFTYITAVTKLKGAREIWENNEELSNAINGNPIKILTFSEMADEAFRNVGYTLATSNIGRIIQLIKASAWMKT